LRRKAGLAPRRASGPRPRPVRDDAETLATLNEAETSRPRTEAREGIDAGAVTLDQYAELGPVHRGKSLQGTFFATALMLPEPRGVVVALTPWNDPVAVACGLLGAALVTGNAVIHKPSEREHRQSYPCRPPTPTRPWTRARRCRGLRSTLRAAANSVDGVAATTLTLRRSAVAVTVRTHRTNTEGLADAVRSAIGHRFDQITPATRPTVRVKVTTTRSAS
jgi:hypothetical protein